MWDYPFNCNALDSAKMAPSTVYQKDSSTSSEQGTDDQITSDTASCSAASTSVQCNDIQPADAISSISSTSFPSDCSSVCSQSPGFTPPLFNTPTSSMNSSISSGESSTRCSTPVANPLVKAGLVPSNLADILSATASNHKSKGANRG